jgi:pyruvate dehydrogenase E1 component alpha subunit/2-oxoisovalerate dehydrogenase E1 component alpha subunit
MISHLGAMISVVNGILMARRMQKRLGSSVGAACLGEGGTSTGAFHEALNQAGVERLPLVMVVANNHYAYSTPTSRQFACKNLVERAVGYGFEGHTVDGTDLGDCLETLQKAVDNARSGRGPQLVVARLLRLCGHGEHDDASYIDPRLKQSEVGRDCLEVAQQRLLAEGWLSDADLRRTRAEVVQSLDESISSVQRESAPTSAGESWQALSSSGLRDSGFGTDPA